MGWLSEMFLGGLFRHDRKARASLLLSAQFLPFLASILQDGAVTTVASCRVCIAWDNTLHMRDMLNGDAGTIQQQTSPRSVRPWMEIMRHRTIKKP